MKQQQSIGFGRLGTMVLLYQFLAYVGYCAFTNFPQNVMSEAYGGTTVTTLMNLIGSLVGYLITYFVVAPNIGKIKSMKAMCVLTGVVALIFCAGVIFIPASQPTLWCICFVFVLITTQLWACFFSTMLIGNWFPRRKGTVMGIVTMAFPLVTGIGLSLFYAQYYNVYGTAMGENIGKFIASGMTEEAAAVAAAAPAMLQAKLVAFAPYWILALIGLFIVLVFLKDFPEQCGAYRDNDKSFTPEQAMQMLKFEQEARKNSVWKRSKIWGCGHWWLNALPSSLLLSCAMAFMVQIIPVLNGYGERLDILAAPGFILTSTGVNSVLFGLSIFACFGSWILGILDTKYGTRTAVFITSIIMLIAGILGMIDNPWCAVAACWLLGLFMGAASNFGLSGVVRYWRGEDFPAVMSGAPPLGTVIGAAFPFLVASIAAKFTYSGAFLFVAIMAVICIVCNRLFNPLKIAEYDNKLRAQAGLPTDDLLAKRLADEKAARKAKRN